MYRYKLLKIAHLKLSSLGWGMENIPDAISQCEQYAKERHALGILLLVKINIQR